MRVAVSRPLNIYLCLTVVCFVLLMLLEHECMNRLKVACVHFNYGCFIRAAISTDLRNALRLVTVNPLNAELIPICHLLALLFLAHHILHVSRIRVKVERMV